MALKWTLAFLAALGGFTAGGIIGSVASDLAGYWYRPGAGFCAALAVVVVAYLAAPTHKLLSATVVLLLGAIAAWIVLEPSWYPESYAPTHAPIIATYVGGALGFLVAAGIHRRARPNNSFKRMPLRGTP